MRSGDSSSGGGGELSPAPFPVERSECHAEAMELLRSRGFHVRRVIRVYSPGDSGNGKHTVLWVDQGGRALESTIEQKSDRLLVQTSRGW